MATVTTRTVPATPVVAYAASIGEEFTDALREHPSLQRAWHRGVAAGKFTEKAADEIAVRVFSTHPCAIWGDIWWANMDAELAEAS